MPSLFSPRNRDSERPRGKRRAAVRALAAGTAALAASTAIAACGSSGAKTELAKIKSSGQLNMAIAAFAPQDFQAKDGSWTGYDVDILKGFAKSLNVKLNISSMQFGASITAVKTKRDDITIDIYYKASRAKVIDYSRPMLNYNDAVAVNSTNPTVTANTVSGLTGKTIAVTSASAEITEAQKVPNATVKQFSSTNDTFQALSAGRVDADLQPDVDVSWAHKQNPSLHIKILGVVPASIAPSSKALRGYYAVPKGSYSKTFLAALNTYLKKIECNGTEQKILDKYGMQSSVYLNGICSASNSYSG